MAVSFDVRAMTPGYEWAWSIIASWLKYLWSSVQPRKPRIFCPPPPKITCYTVAIIH